MMKARNHKMTTKITLEGFVGEVYDYLQDELKTTSYKGMENQLKSIDGDIELHINSKGGDAFEGMAIMNALNNYTGGEKVAIVDGFCASAATLPLFAMDKVKAHKTTMFVFHKSATMAFGHSSDLRKSADELDTIDGAVVDLYMERFTGTVDELHALLDADKIITAQQALDYGFVDELVSDDTTNDESEDNAVLSAKTPENIDKPTKEQVVEMSKEQVDKNNDMLGAFMQALKEFK